MPFEIRDARDSDAPGIVPLLAELGHPATEPEIQERLRSLRSAGPYDRVLVALAGDRVVGLVSLHVTPVLHRPRGVGRVTVMVVHSDSQRAGIGKALMAQAERILVEAGCRRIELTSAADREGAHRFYRGLGYREEGVRFAKEIDR